MKCRTSTGHRFADTIDLLPMGLDLIPVSGRDRTAAMRKKIVTC